MHFHFFVSGSSWYHEDWEHSSNVKSQSGSSHHPHSWTTAHWGKSTSSSSSSLKAQQMSILKSSSWFASRFSCLSWCFLKPNAYIHDAGIVCLQVLVEALFTQKPSQLVKVFIIVVSLILGLLILAALVWCLWKVNIFYFAKQISIKV